jgi:benzodiazapine receptor
MTGRSKALLGVFSALVVVSASVIGQVATLPNIPGWYAGINKPGFTPPNWVFGPVWTTLYVLMAVAFWRVLVRRRVSDPASLAFLVQMALNAFWSVAFFGLHNPVFGLWVIVALEAAILVTIRLFYRVDRIAAWLLVPYALWVGYATLLNAAIVRLN